MSNLKPDPLRDGVDHINVYSKGRTELGRLLSNFAQTPFDCIDGHFESVEGYWYWLLAVKEPVNRELERLRSLHGFEAKRVGKEIENIDRTRPVTREFRECIYNAFAAKLKANPRVQELLKASTLPFKHYYVYERGVQVLPEFDWLMVYWENLRDEAQGSESI